MRKEVWKKVIWRSTGWPAWTDADAFRKDLRSEPIKWPLWARRSNKFELAALPKPKTLFVKVLPSEVFGHISTPRPDTASGHDFGLSCFGKPAADVISIEFSRMRALVRDRRKWCSSASDWGLTMQHNMWRCLCVLGRLLCPAVCLVLQKETRDRLEMPSVCPLTYRCKSVFVSALSNQYCRTSGATWLKKL